MASYDRKWQKVTREQLEHCVRWCQNVLQLRDWKINLYLTKHEKHSDEFGYTWIQNSWQEEADIWISVDYLKEKDCNAYSTVCHEMLHVLLSGKCNIEAAGNTDEYAAYILESVLYEKFCRDNKIKEMPMKDD